MKIVISGGNTLDHHIFLLFHSIKQSESPVSLRRARNIADLHLLHASCS
jgi:hypothetical protein